MFNNTIKFTRNKKTTDSYGRILGNKCIRETITTVSCVAIQRVSRNSDSFIEKGFEGIKNSFRFDFRTTDLSTLVNLSLADYIEYTDTLGNKHEHKVLDFETRTILGCTWVTIYTENLTARDIKEVLSPKVNVTA